MAEESFSSRPNWLRMRSSGLVNRLERLPAWQAASLVALGVLGVDWALAPKGQSLLSKAAGKVGLGHGGLLLPPPARIPPPIPSVAPPAAAGEFFMMPPPPGVLDGSVYGGGGQEFTGANLHSGFGHGYMPYGGWAHADPGGPTQYAHAAQRRHGFDWE